MNKVGQIFEVLGILVVVGMAVVGTTFVYLSKDVGFVGNNVTKELYNYEECPEVVANIPNQDVVKYDSLKSAQKEGFSLRECYVESNK